MSTPTANGPHSGSQGPLSTPATTSGPSPSSRNARPQPARSDDAQGAVIDGAELLDQVHAALLRYVVLPSDAAGIAVVLWIAATHAQPAWAHAPRLVIRAPEKRCGKSRLLDVIEALCWNPFITVNSSPAAVYRSITDDPPTGARQTRRSPVPGVGQWAYRPSWSSCSSGTGVSRMRRGRQQLSSGGTPATSSPPRPASRSTQAPTTTSGSGSLPALGCATAGCTTPVTQPRRLC
jgi:hypothetical protein